MRRAKVRRVPRYSGGYSWEVEFHSPVTGRPFVGWYSNWSIAVRMAAHWVDFR